jgi:hypothetical protein
VYEGFESFRRFRARMQLILAVPLSRFDGPAAHAAVRDVIHDLSDAGYPMSAIREMTLGALERAVADTCGSAWQRDALLYWVEGCVDEQCAVLASRAAPELTLTPWQRTRPTVSAMA